MARLGGCLRLDLGVLLHSLDGHDVRLAITRHAHHPVETLRHLQGIADRQSGDTRVDAAPRDHGEKRREGHNAGPDELEAHRQPAIRGHVEVVRLQVCVQLDVLVLDEPVLRAEGSDGAHSLQHLAECTENRRPRDGVQPLQLARRRDVVVLRVPVERPEGQQTEEEEGRRERDDHHDS
eukprot:scaffold167_cov244-Pinguiococcus_pyrenoidosus.AAC.2